MQTTLPNIFDHARSESCQDAFLAWILEWAAPCHARSDKMLHDAGRAFIRFLYAEHEAGPPDHTNVRVVTQYRGIDVVAFLTTAAGETHCILIEDKISAGRHSDRLDHYIDVLKGHHPDTEVLPIHLQTWFIGHPVPTRKFRSIDLKMMAEFLRGEEWSGITDSIFTGFRDHLERRYARSQEHRQLKVTEWNADQWMGFFNELRERLAVHGCTATFERNPRSSGPIAVLRMQNETLPSGALCRAEIHGDMEPKVRVRINSRDAEVVDRMYRQLLPQAAANQITLQRSEGLRRGSTSIVGTVPPEQYLQDDGRMDMDRIEQIMTSLNQMLAAQAVMASRASLVE